MARILALLIALMANSPQAAMTPRTVAGLPPAATSTRGAVVPFDEYEAENGLTNGTLIGPDRRFATLPAEASGRRAVRLRKPGDFIEFTLARAANAITVRAAIPDGNSGEGRDETLGIFANDRPLGTLALTSRYSWYYGVYPFSNRPAEGSPHHYFDETRLLFGRLLPAGTRVQIRVRRRDTAPWYVIDLADFEKVPPPSVRPVNAVSVVDCGADASGVKPSDVAFEHAIQAANRWQRTLWIPPGTYRVDRHLLVDRVHIRGAGPWYSIVRGHGVGFYGKQAPDQSVDVRLEDFFILGEVTERVDGDQVNGIGGAIGGGSIIRNLWIQHTKAGLWFDGPMQGITVSALRILDTTADGLNFHRGVSDAVVENTFVRGTGDDGLAAWSGGQADHHILFRNNTIIAPVLANGIAIYGGHDIIVRANVVADTLTEGGAYHLGNRFNAVPASGNIVFDRDIAIRSGSIDPRWGFGVGAIWFYALDEPISADVRLQELTIIDSTDEAIQFLGKPIGEVWMRRLRIEGARGAVVQIQSKGIAHISESRAIGIDGPAVRRCDSGFRLSSLGNYGMVGDSEVGCPLARR